VAFRKRWRIKKEATVLAVSKDSFQQLHEAKDFVLVEPQVYASRNRSNIGR